MLLTERHPVDEDTRAAVQYWIRQDFRESGDYGALLDRVLTGRRGWDVVWPGAMMRSTSGPEKKLVGVALSLYQAELGEPAPFPSYAQIAEDTGFAYHAVTWAVPDLILEGLLAIELPPPTPEPAPTRPAARQKAKIPTALRWAVWERDNYTCQDCGTRRNLSIDHIVPESKGGPTTLENLRTLCVPCNSRKGARLVAVSLAGQA